MSTQHQGVLYGSPHSFYTAKVRCYLRKQGIAYQEKMPKDPEYTQKIVPHIGRAIIPVWVGADGEMIQDSLDIIDHFERQGVPLSAYPKTPKQHLAALWFEYFASFCMLRPAMHYRWSYLDKQRDYLKDANIACSGLEAAANIMERMHSYLPGLGVIAQTLTLIEQRFVRFLDLLEAHFAEHPYLLGGQPSIGDYGLIGPMYAHLARDPVPAYLIRTRAPKVFRWIERMTASDADIPEYPDYPTHFLGGDCVPQTLEALLGFMAEEIFPELDDKLTFIEQWTTEHRPVDGQLVNAKAHQRYIGIVQTKLHGVAIDCAVAPYMLYVLKRIDQVLSSLTVEAELHAANWLSSLGLTYGFNKKCGYSVRREKHREVWEHVQRTA